MKLRAIAPVALVALIAGACADSSSTTSNDGGIEHPTGIDQLVLRVATGGGFTAPEYQLRLIPEFSLYGDGSLITPGPQIEIYPPPALPSVQTQPVSEDGVQAILQAAIDAGVDTTHDMTDMGSTMVADAATTTFTISVNGATNSFGVYALGMFEGDCPDRMSAKECDARTALSSLVQQLGDLQSWLPTGSLGETATYEPSGSRVYVGDVRRDADLPQQKVAWPLDPPLASFGEDTGAGYRCGVVTGADWTDTLQPLAAGSNELTPWTSGGISYGLIFRPLLPDETGC
ncbi:MAG: hypothetical protein ACXWZU_01635 [Actinomycetota bacterium]